LGRLRFAGGRSADSAARGSTAQKVSRIAVTVKVALRLCPVFIEVVDFCPVQGSPIQVIMPSGVATNNLLLAARRVSARQRNRFTKKPFEGRKSWTDQVIVSYSRAAFKI
jgi:hypothetical protein